MSVQELNVLMQKINNNNTQIIYPITKVSNVVTEDNGMSVEELFLDFASAIITESEEYLITEDKDYIVTGL